MTVRAFMIKFLYERGMFPQQAEAALAPLFSDPDHSMVQRWDDQIEGYPPQISALMVLAASDAAVDWIDANLPKAWYRPIFARDDPVNPTTA